MKVAVSNEFLSYRPSFWITKKVELKNVSYSHLTRIGPKPMNLYVFQAGSPTAIFTIRLRAFADEDVDWLLSLPWLRITEKRK